MSRGGRQRPDQQPGAADPIGEGVVQLAENRNSAALKAFDHVALPQRPAAVEQRDIQVADELHQLLWRTRSRERDVAHVVIEVDGINRHPSGQAAER
jgi:hypothetical protein